MGKLTTSQINEYFDVHLPYRTRIMLAHYKMTRASWTIERGPVAWLQACFEASLITGRLYLNVLGVTAKRDGSALKALVNDPNCPDVAAEDLGGTRLNLTLLQPNEQSLFLHFIIMANKAAAHLTMPGNYDLDQVHPAIHRIHYYLKTNLYDPSGRIGLESLV